MNQKISKKIVHASIIVLIFIGLLVFIKNNKKEPNIINEQGNQLEETAAGDTKIQQDLVLDSAPTIKFDDKNKELFNDLLAKGNTALMSKEYEKAISFYQQALKYNDADVVYARLFTVYNIQNNTVKAIESINNAIKRFPAFTEYWVTKLVYLDEKTNTSFAELKQIYTDGLSKVDSRTKTNLVISFARIAESNGMKDEAIAAWQKGIELYPSNKSIYQAEIDRLKSL